MVETRLASATSGDERSVACRSVARLQGKRTQAPSNTFSYSFQDHAWIWLPKTVGDRATAAQAVRDESDVTEGRIAAEKMLIDVRLACSVPQHTFLFPPAQHHQVHTWEQFCIPANMTLHYR